MIGKVIGGKSFAGSVGYVMKRDAEILDSEGVTPPEVKDMVQDFSDQSLLNPRIKNTVGHISLSFSERDKAKLDNQTMTEIAREYMQKMGITDTQFLIVRHHDAPHPHCHIVYNRVRDDGSTVPDSNIRLRNVAVCRELTEWHGLYLASDKEQVREHRLREPDKTKYEIYNTITTLLPRCKSWGDLERNLLRQGIGLEFKCKGSTDIREGVRFTKGQYTFSGSKIDQRFSYSKLNDHFNRVQKQDAPTYSQQSRDGLKSAASGFLSAFTKCFGSTGSVGSGSTGSGEINLAAFGAGSLPQPPVDLGIAITAAQLQRQPDETSEQHIARITALINSVTAAMIAHAEEQKRKQQQIKKPQRKL
ncbi:MAG: relaxase/mobilization nuclease domain-containing protein [Alistipes sp.]|jgi:hypothetical protein|nr:relaxase/mobilization nuclease domain-containing protein [Alistipes sp.]